MPERIVYSAVRLPGTAGDGFEDDVFRDADRTGSAWPAAVLRAGSGGGSGRLGDLFVAAGETRVLNTDSEVLTPMGRA